MKLKAHEVAELVGGIVEGDKESTITKLSKIESGDKKSLSFLGNPKYNDYLYKTSNKIDFIFNIKINFEILKERILKRSSEESRDDDNINVIETRFSEYLNTTEKVSNFYKDKQPDKFHEIDGSLQIEQITKKIMEILKKS